MKRAKTQEEKYRQMMEMPVSRLIPGLAVPTIISMLITSIYNMADTFFVSQLGTSASGAVGVIFSAMARAPGSTFPSPWETRIQPKRERRQRPPFSPCCFWGS